MEYYITAVRFPHLPESPNIASMRLGLIMPVAALYRVFGHSEITYYGIPLLSAGLLSVSVFFVGYGLFNRRVGLIAAFWVQLVPNLLLESGHLLPDLPSAAFYTAGIALLVGLYPINDRIKPLLKTNWGFFFAGLLFGWSYLSKEYIAVLFLLIPILFWALKIPFKRLIPTAAGMLSILCLEMIIGQAYYQNPLIRFLAATPRETVGHIEMDVGLILKFFPRLLNRSGGIGTLILSVVGAIGSITMGLWRERKFTLLFSWSAIFYLFFTLMGLLPFIFSWKDIVLLRLHKFRYWIPILPPLIIGGIAIVDLALARLFGKFKLAEKMIQIRTVAILGLMMILSTWIGLDAVWNDQQFIRNGADHYQELRAFLKENNTRVDTIWVTRDSRRGYARILPIYTHTPWGKPIWEGRLKYMNTEDEYLRADEINVGYVIIDRNFNDPDLYDVPEYLSDIPANWKLAFESENQKLALYAVE